MRQTNPGGWLAGFGKAALTLAFAVAGAHAFAAGIAGTKHNLGSTGAIVGQNKTSSTAEICVFCHTPHAAATGAEVPPLWNKTLPASASYTTYSSTNSSTIDGEVASVGSVSIACLSCHDGSQAMDNIINAPGSGGYDSTGGGANGLAWTWSGASVDLNGKMTSATIAMLGTNLVNDHPIGIQYCGGGYTTAAATGTCKDTDFKALQSSVTASSRVFWVDTAVGTAGTRQKTDMILYNRAFAVAGTTGPAVECASCHDPHVNSADAGSQAGATFLRISNAGSAVCLACHVK